MLAVNLGTRGVAEALRPAGVRQPPRRHGAVRPARRARVGEPYGIRMWCLGNEMDGPWQIGHKTAARVRPARRRDRPGDAHVDPDLELVACGSSGRGDADLRRVGGDRARRGLRPRRPHLAARLLRADSTATCDTFLASAVDMDRFIDDRRSPPATTCGPSSSGSKQHQPVASTSGTSGTMSRLQADHAPPTGRTRPRLLEDDYTVPTRSSSAACSSRCCGTPTG